MQRFIIFLVASFQLMIDSQFERYVQNLKKDKSLIINYLMNPAVDDLLQDLPTSMNSNFVKLVPKSNLLAFGYSKFQQESSSKKEYIFHCNQLSNLVIQHTLNLLPFLKGIS